MIASVNRHRVGSWDSTTSILSADCGGVGTGQSCPSDPLAAISAEAHPGPEVRLEVGHLAADSVAAVELDAETQQEMRDKLERARRGIRSGSFSPFANEHCARKLGLAGLERP